MTYGFPGIPDLFDHDQVVAQYEQASGTTVRDLPFYYVLHNTLLYRLIAD